jgi:coenzyme F420-reducing hydrogenase delta subunit
LDSDKINILEKKMKVSKELLRKIIREEKQKIIAEAISKTDSNTIQDIIDELTNSVKMHRSQADRLQSILDRLTKQQEEN